MATTQRVPTASARRGSVVGSDLRMAEPVEQHLKFARASEFAHNTVKAYARGLASSWTGLAGHGRTSVWPRPDVIQDLPRLAI